MRGSVSGVRPASGPVPGTQPMFHTHTLHTAMSSQRGLWPGKSGDSGGKEAGGKRADKNVQGREQGVSCWRGWHGGRCQAAGGHGLVLPPPGGEHRGVQQGQRGRGGEARLGQTGLELFAGISGVGSSV